MEIKILIPARKNSKGLPGKNLKRLCGKPLIDYTIETSLKLFEPNSIILSSDSEEILKRGKRFGIKTILRPNELAEDNSKIIDTILHAADIFSRDEKTTVDSIILLQPTFPIRDYLELREAIEIYKTNKYRSLVSIVKMKEHPCECINFDKKNPEQWRFIIDPKKNTNRQSYLGEYFFINGNFYIAGLEYLKTYKSFFFKKTNFFECKYQYDVDIDDIHDFKFAEYCLSKKLDNY